jgi:hypothetical protein
MVDRRKFFCIYCWRQYFLFDFFTTQMIESKKIFEHHLNILISLNSFKYKINKINYFNLNQVKSF